MSPSKARRFVAYYRVSTERQGSSGLGLEAQQKAVRDYLNGGAWELVGEFVEVECNSPGPSRCSRVRLTPRLTTKSSEVARETQLAGAFSTRPREHIPRM